MILRNLFAGQQWRHRHREESGKEERKRSCSVVSGSLRTPWTVAHQTPPSMGFSSNVGLQTTRFLRPQNFPGKSTGVGCHLLLQRLFLTQGSNPGLSHCRQTLYCLSHQGSPQIQNTGFLYSLVRSTLHLISLFSTLQPEMMLVQFSLVYYCFVLHLEKMLFN